MVLGANVSPVDSGEAIIYEPANQKVKDNCLAIGRSPRTCHEIFREDDTPIMCQKRQEKPRVILIVPEFLIQAFGDPAQDTINIQRDCN